MALIRTMCALIGAIAACDTLGLRPEDFDAKRLTSSLSSYGASADDENAPGVSARARLDVSLTANALRFVTALARGRLDPQAAGADLFISRGAFEPVWNGTAFEPRQMLPLSLSYDHRLIDGADAIRFLRWVAEALENPFALTLRG